MMKSALFPCAVALLFGSGCWFMSEPVNDPVNTYDLAAPAQRKEACEFVRIRSLAPGGMKMLFREADGRIVEDASICWVQPPESMLLRYLRSAFAPAAKPHVHLTLLRFELDRGRALAVLTCDLSLERNPGAEKVRRYEFTAPLKTGAAPAAAAMSACAAQLADTISQTLQEKK